MNGFLLFLEIINLIYSPFGFLFSILFNFTKSYMRTISVSLLIFNIAKILIFMKRKKLRILLLIWFIGYSLYEFGLFINLAQMEDLDRTALIFSIVAPLSMLIVGKQVAYFKIKGHRIFAYLVVMFLYLLLALLWYYIYPEEIIFGWVFVYWSISLGIVLIFKKFYGEEVKNG